MRLSRNEPKNQLATRIPASRSCCWRGATVQRLNIGAAWIELHQGDITRQDTDAIVSAANSGLRGGGGVDGAIHAAGGSSIMTECRRLGGCPTGDAKITTAGRLKAKFVVHAVGPVYRGGASGEADLLAGAYRRSIEVAAENGAISLAFPSISTGVYGYPIQAASRIALATVVATLPGHPALKLVRFVLFSAADLAVYEAALAAQSRSLEHEHQGQRSS